MVKKKVCRLEIPIKLSSEGRNRTLPFPKQECHIQHSALLAQGFLCFCGAVAMHAVLASSEGQCHLKLSRKTLVSNTRFRIIQLVLSQFTWQNYSA